MDAGMTGGGALADGAAALSAGIVHTVPALAGTFQTAMERALPGVELVHIADPWLLTTAIGEGITDAVRQRLHAHLNHLVRGGAHAVLVTCSSIGEAVEESAAALPIPVLRVDEPMARDAVARAAEVGKAGNRAGSIQVLATLQATLGPTGRLIARYAGGADGEVAVSARVVDGAAAARSTGDQERHDALIMQAVADTDADVIVLAQASMADAARGATVPVLTSPAGGVRAFVEALTR